ncbi:MAG TPA: hypothetical protein VL738_05835 [Dactylosporangium sp.]|nr:hypothetical protein [Dactylosporangium sp.]
MTIEWFEGGVELVAGYTLRNAGGEEVGAVERARLAIQGGYLHVDVPGAGVVQIVSAPGVHRVTYQTPGP